MNTMHAHGERLRAINSFPSLVKYLRDELDWSVESDDFDQLTYEYEPGELGIDEKAAVKVKYVKQLRPLSGAEQPWAVFFLSFDPGRLPVVILRRILRAFALKKRPGAAPAGQAKCPDVFHRNQNGGCARCGPL